MIRQDFVQLVDGQTVSAEESLVLFLTPTRTKGVAAGPPMRVPRAGAGARLRRCFATRPPLFGASRDPTACAW